MRILFFLMVGALCFSCGILKKLSDSDINYFEGEVVYSIDFKFKVDGYSLESLQNYYGAKILLTFKDGNYRKKYVSNSGTILSTRYLDLSENRSYLTMLDNDTIYWYDISKPDSKTSFKKLKDTTILNYPSIVLLTETLVGGEVFGTEKYRVSGKSYYAKDFPVNPDWYKNYREANFNELVKVAKGIQILSVNYEAEWDRYIQVEKVIRKTVSAEEVRFIPEEGAPMKEL